MNNNDLFIQFFDKISTCKIRLFRIVRRLTGSSPTPAAAHGGALHSLAAKSRTNLVRMASNASSFAGRRYASFHLPHPSRHRHQGAISLRLHSYFLFLLLVAKLGLVTSVL